MRPRRLNIFLHTLISSKFIITLWLILLLLAVAGSSQVALADAPEAICTPPIQPVALLNPVVITNCSNQTQLQIALANGGHIRFNCGLAPVTIPIISPMTTSATQDIILDGGGLITLNGLNSSRILVKPFTPGAEVDKNKGNDLTLQNIRLINGRAPAATQNQDSNARGGAVWVTSPGTKLHLINVTFENNRTTSLTDEDNQGGAVFAANIYETIITGSVFDNNEAGNGGAFGGIATGLIVYNSRFSNNKASDSSSGGIVRGHGGAIHLDGVSNNFNPLANNVVDICGSVFEDNTAVRGGGAIKVTISDNLGTKAFYQHSSFINNRLVGVAPVEGHGGAIYHIEDDFAGGANEDNIEIRGSTFAGNYAYRQGGGAWILVQGRGKVINSTFSGNEASQAGSNRVGQGGALILSGVIEVINSTFANNFATFQGGAIFAGGSSAVSLANTLFYRNHLDPTHTNPVTSEFQGYHTNRPMLNGGNNLQFPRTKAPDFPNDINNLITSPASAIIFTDPLLGPLADNGGSQQTMALGAGSPAINAGNLSVCPATDQRGIGRPQGSGCDIGAYEVVTRLTASPNLVAIADGAFSLTVTGDGFNNSSQVLWNSQPVPTTFIDSTRLQAAVSSVILGNVPGNVSVSVNNSPLTAATVVVVQSLTRSHLPIISK